MAHRARHRAPVLPHPREGRPHDIYLASSPDVEGKSGGYYARSRPARPTRAAQDDEAARRLWEVSAQLVGLEG